MKYAFLTICSLGVIGLASAAPAGGWYYPLPTPTRMICNCNDPTTKETSVEPLCKSAGGQDSFQIWNGVEAIQQHMCLLNNQVNTYFTNENCRKEFGPSYNSFCKPYF